MLLKLKTFIIKTPLSFFLISKDTYLYSNDFSIELNDLCQHKDSELWALP